MSSHGGESGGKRYRLVIILTGLLGLVGVFMLINEALFGGMHYNTVEEYEDAKGEHMILKDAPVLPLCAEDISISRTRTEIETITFTCEDEVMVDVFLTDIDTEAVWSARSFESGRVLLSPMQ